MGEKEESMVNNSNNKKQSSGTADAHKTSRGRGQTNTSGEREAERKITRKW